MKVGILGCAGRVGKILINELQSGAWKGLTLAGGFARTPDENADYFTTNDAKILFEQSDILIDFTLPEATRTHINMAAEMGKKLVIGTTGLTADDEAFIGKAAQKTAILYAANMSLGVNLLLALVEQAAASLDPSWDIEIFESHHKHKIDAPSGTALAFGKAAAKGRKVNLDDVITPARHGNTGQRETGTIGFSVARGGDVVGEHTAFFYGEAERIELTHIARDRKIFARGALKAAQWLAEKPNGLYSMRDVLGV